MGRERAAEAEVLQAAAGILSGEGADITRRWVNQLEATLYAGRAGLDVPELRDRVPDLVHGVAEALQGGEMARS